MKKLNIILLFALVTLTACSSLGPQRGPSSYEAPDYKAIFKKTRESLIAPQNTKIKIPAVAESQLVQFLQDHPEWMNEEQFKLLAEVEKYSKTSIDQTKHTRLIPPDGNWGYQDVKIFISHPYYEGNKLKSKDNLVKAWIDFINQAQFEIILNVFDFDLEEVAHALVAKVRQNVKVQVGIDKEVIAARQGVQKVVKILTDGGVEVTQVDSVGLNHQKVTAIDWSHPQLASVLFSSGNLTRSCIEPDGDLKGLIPLPKESIPNANHLITMKSFILANLVNHELTKTLDEKFRLRGRQYPMNGSYQLTGPNVNPSVLEAYPEPSIIITFAPNGGLKNINKNLISHILRKEKGSIRMIQFAFSSKDVEEALLFRAEQDIQTTKKFDFMSIGDTPFAMRNWSRFLVMSGLKLNLTPKKHYVDDLEGTWFKKLGPKQMKELRKNIYVAPKIYGEHHLRIDGKAAKANGKIHHKILATPNFAIMGTSFNFSEGAESNNEQLLIFRDKKMSKIVNGMLKYLVSGSPGHVKAEADRRNQVGVTAEEEGAIDEREALK